ncbi:thioredoxin-disulfide reductase [Gulosibacter macacae]|uniref:Thioredoxin reductase n=1 Tax=Gulosibacter macacae TaxID=2488791 RepID=A0A3P3VY43_9MICO|nr:thioredoxin-disulfide reductase [Gulosibacter macacae]RRJ86526.1 thioredoxin-disulfide reductase [Gulosibacter macacae]
MRNVAIIGSGPAGYTAAIYVARAGLKPVMFTSAVTVGGELMNTTDVENFPGFPDGVMGPDLMQKMQEQAERFGTELVYDDVESVDLSGEIKRIRTSYSGEYEALAVIIATGSAYRRLGLESEDRLAGRGISWCATCDGAFFKEQHIAVVGGGDSAMEEATFLTRFADRVTVIHRSDNFRASKIMLERARANPKIDWVTNVTVEEILGDQQVSGVRLRDTVTGDERKLDLTGIFVAIGNVPRTELVAGQIDLTESGVIAVEGRSSRTSLPGVFACGDVVDDHYRQAITAAGSGCTAALDAEAYLAGLPAELLAKVDEESAPSETPAESPIEVAAAPELGGITLNPIDFGNLGLAGLKKEN